MDVVQHYSHKLSIVQPQVFGAVLEAAWHNRETLVAHRVLFCDGPAQQISAAGGRARAR